MSAEIASLAHGDSPQSASILSKAVQTGFTWRMFFAGCLGVLIACGIAVHGALVVRTTPLGTSWFPWSGVISFLLILFVLNPILRLVRMELNRTELTIVLAMTFMGSVMPVDGFAMTFATNLLSSFYFATPSNAWWERVLQYTPAFLYPADARAITWFWDGVPVGESAPWGAWTGPLLFWGIIFGAYFGMLISIAAIMRKQWVENERLIFPLMEVPALLLEGTDRGLRIPPIMRSRLFWAGALLVIVNYGLRIAHFRLPSVPAMNFFGEGVIRLKVGETWSETALNHIPALVALGYLVKRDVLLSYWVFGLLAYCEANFLNSIGYNAGPSLGGEDLGPAISWQSLGALLVFSLSGLFMARGHLKNVMRKIFFNAKDVDDSREIMSFRSLGAMLVVCAVTMNVFLLKMGMTFAAATTLMVVLVLMYLAATRFVIESGLVFGRLPVSPFAIMIGIFGAKTMPLATLGALTACLTFTFLIKNGIMPSFANTMKLIEPLNLKRGTLMKAAVIAMLLGATVSLGATLFMCYQEGALNSNQYDLRFSGQQNVQALVGSLDSVPKPSETRFKWAALGMTLMVVLIYGRYNFAWWPLHPIGLPLASGWEVQRSVFSFFVAWLCKTVLLRLGGVPLYNKAKPFFIGLLLGQVFIAFSDYIVDWIFGGPGLLVTM